LARLIHFPQRPTNFSELFVQEQEDGTLNGVRQYEVVNLSCASPKLHPAEKLNRRLDILTVKSRLDRPTRASWKTMKTQAHGILARHRWTTPDFPSKAAIRWAWIDSIPGRWAKPAIARSRGVCTMWVRRGMRLCVGDCICRRLG